MAKRKDPHKNVVCITDTHGGCQAAICGADPVPLDDGGLYMPSRYQKILWNRWEQFWGEWVPMATRKEPYCVVHLGDAIDGDHHGSKTQISTNTDVQLAIAEKLLKPVVAKCDGRYYHVRGTEAHVGKSAEWEERLAKSLDAVPDRDGRRARWVLWKRIGPGLFNFMHHIGTTGSSAYESTAVYKELVEAYNEAGRWEDEAPQGIVRGHRHRNLETRVPCAKGYAMAIVVAGWQLKTPFAHKIPGGRQSEPQIGGTLIRMGDEEAYARHKVWRLDRPAEE